MKPIPPSPTALTPRQLQVLQLVVDGRSYKQIAVMLGIAVPTVKHHVKAATLRMNATSRMQLSMLALDAHYITYTIRQLSQSVGNV